MTSQANITDFFNSRKRVGSSNVKSRAKVLVLEAEKCLKLAAQETSVTKARIVFQQSKDETSTSNVKTTVIKKSTRSTKKSSKKLDSEPLKQSLLTKFTIQTSTVLNSETITTQDVSPPLSQEQQSIECVKTKNKGPSSETQVETSSTAGAQAGTCEATVPSEIKAGPSKTPARAFITEGPSSKTPIGTSETPVVPSKAQIGTSETPIGPSSSKRPSSKTQSGTSKTPVGSSSTAGPSTARVHSQLLDVASQSSPARVVHSPVRKLGTPRALLFGESPVKRIDKTKNKDLSLAEIRGKLKCGGRKTEELKSRLSKFTKLSSQLSAVEDEERTLKLKQFESIEVEVPLSPCKAPYSSPVKAPLSPLKSPGKTVGCRLAAWQQYRTLVEARAPTLPLPWRYRGLYDKFKALDVIVNMMTNRGEACTFVKLQPAVEEMTRLNFSDSQLGQIVSLYPEAFTLTQQRKAGFALTGRPDKYELVVAPNYDTVQDSEEKGKVGPRTLQTRYQKFHSLLVSRVMDFHQEFLSQLEPPMEIAREKLTRWHPGFDVEQIPDVEVASLPEPPHVNKFTSAREVLEHARDMVSCNPRVQEALSRMSHNRDSVTSATQVKQSSDTSATKVKQSSDTQATPPINPALRGISTALLDKIRARQAARAVEAMTRSAAEDLQQSKLQRLPELARVTRNIYVSEKKTVLTSEVLVDKLIHSYPHSLTSRELTELVELLVVEAPSLIQRVYLRNTTFFKINKDTKMSEVISTLENKLRPI